MSLTGGSYRRLRSEPHEGWSAGPGTFDLPTAEQALILRGMPVDPELLDILACPACKTPVRLVKDGAALKCDSCHRVYPIKDDIPVMLIDEATVEP